MRVDVFSIFPDAVDEFCSASLLGKARSGGILDLRCHDIREHATDAHRSVDDAPFGGGAGMLMMAEPIFAAVEDADPPRPLLLLVTGLGVSTIGTGWGLGLAYRFRDMRAAALMQLTLFLSLFLTPAQTPMTVMRGWLHDVARFNPFTNVLRFARAGFLGEIRWADLWGGLLALVVLGSLAMWFARRGLDKLER